MPDIFRAATSCAVSAGSRREFWRPWYAPRFGRGGNDHSQRGFGTVPFSVTHAIGHSHVNTGWTVGYGTEGRLAIPGWTWKVEGLYVDLGSIDDPDSVFVISSVSGG
jgi:hypothetical protein